MNTPAYHRREADNAREQPGDDQSDRAPPAETIPHGDKPAPETPTGGPVERAERGSRDVDAPRRGAPPGAAPPDA